MATVAMTNPGIWLVMCDTHGYLGAAIHMAGARARQLADEHNRTHHLEEEKES